MSLSLWERRIHWKNISVERIEREKILKRWKYLRKFPFSFVTQGAGRNSPPLENRQHWKWNCTSVQCWQNWTAQQCTNSYAARNAKHRMFLWSSCCCLQLFFFHKLTLLWVSHPLIVPTLYVFWNSLHQKSECESNIFISVSAAGLNKSVTLDKLDLSTTKQL